MLSSNFVLKILTSAIMVALIAEIGRRSTMAAAVLASLHVTTVLALVWVYLDTRDTERVAVIAANSFWLIIASLAFFIAFPVLLRQGLNFFIALAVAAAITIIIYFLTLYGLRLFGIELR
jgi:hypothetical protein